MALQRAFSGFPTGYAGLALLLLRLLVGGAASVQAWLFVASTSGGTVISGAVAALVFVTGLALTLGAATPIASALLTAAGLLAALDARVAAHLPLFDSYLARLEFIAMAVALTSLGPGALSVDARLYGRREIKVNGNGS